MAPVRPAAAFDTEALRRGVEERDSGAMIGLYADDAEMQVVDRRSQPSSPQVLKGREQIAPYLDEVCGRDMAHRLERVVVDGDRAAFLESCAYPDGVRVLCAALLDLEDGRIVRQTCVQAWDE
jgi:ketosteroid isomerase-like protein